MDNVATDTSPALDTPFDLGRLLVMNGGLVSQAEILATFPDVPREDLTRAREEIGATMRRSTETGQ